MVGLVSLIGFGKPPLSSSYIQFIKIHYAKAVGDALSIDSAQPFLIESVSFPKSADKASLYLNF